jgi:DNA-dependent RNA polymerase auxiliary subunit epsilon
LEDCKHNLALKDRAVESANLKSDEAVLAAENDERKIKAITDKLRTHNIPHRAYVFLKRERKRESSSRPYTRPDRRNPSPVDSRRDWCTVSPSRRGSPLPPSNLDSHLSGQTLGATSPNLYAGNHRQPSVPITTTLGALPFTTLYKFPDIDSFLGAAAEDYERWRRTAMAKCSTLPEEERMRVIYLERYIKGDAWELISSDHPQHHIDIIDRLDDVYLTYDRISKAETKLIDSNLKQKDSESFPL